MPSNATHGLHGLQGNALGLDTPLVILDTETTGLDHKTEKVIEIAAVKLLNGQPTETFNMMVNPGIPIRHSSFLIHGITDEEVANAPPIEEVLPQFLDFMGDLPFAAHSALFDYSFINEPMKALYGRRFDNHRIDTLEMYKAVFPEEPSHGLSALLERFGFPSEVKHRALDDAMALAQVYPHLRALYEQKYQWQLAQLPNISYLLERYLRLQKACQMLQGEMSDLRDVFKLHFAEGGKSVQATTGEVLSSHYRRSYTYNDATVWQILHQAGMVEKGARLNPRALDKILDRKLLDADLLEQLKESRTMMQSTLNVSIQKPGTGQSQNGKAGGGVAVSPSAPDEPVSDEPPDELTEAAIAD